MPSNGDAFIGTHPRTWNIVTVQRYLARVSTARLPRKEFFVKFYCWTENDFLHAKSVVDDHLQEFTNGDDLLVLGNDLRLTIERALISQDVYLFKHHHQGRACTRVADNVKRESLHDRINERCVNQIFISWCRKLFNLKRYHRQRAATLQAARNAQSQNGNTQTRDRSSTVESQSSLAVNDTPSQTSAPDPTLPDVRGTSATPSSLLNRRRRSLTDSESTVSSGGHQSQLSQQRSATDRSTNKADSSSIAVLSMPSQVLEQFDRSRSHSHDATLRPGQKRNPSVYDLELGSKRPKRTLPIEGTLERLMIFAVMITTQAEIGNTGMMLDRNKYFRVGQFLNDSTGRVNFLQLKDFATQNIEGCSIFWVNESQDGIQILPITDEYAAEIAFETLHEKVSRDGIGPVQIFAATSEQLVAGVPEEELCELIRPILWACLRLCIEMTDTIAGRRGNFEIKVVLRERYGANR